MMKIIVLISALVAIASAKPSLVSAPLIAAPAPVVTATSSQYYHRINNGLAAYYAAPAAYVAPAAPYVASPYVASPYVAAASPYVAAPAVVAYVILLSITCGIVKSSGFHPVGPAGAAPIVTAASSQYFERTFNRLVAAPVQPFIPVAPAPPIPVAPAPQPIIPVLPLPPARPVVVDAPRTTPVGNPTNALPSQSAPSDPNVAIAVATAHAAAPVATILLPPYPFGLPPSFGFIPQSPQAPPQPTDNPKINRESTTRRTTSTQVTTTERVQEATTPVSSNIDNSFAQALPSNQNVNFKQYLAPAPAPNPRPQKVKTNVEVVPVPLAYIAPPPLDLHHHHHHQHHHHHHQHQALKVVPHIHTFIPKTRIIVRPATSLLRVRTVTIPAGFAKYGPPEMVKKVVKRYPQNIKSRSRDTEPTTFRPVNFPFTKPPRIIFLATIAVAIAKPSLAPAALVAPAPLVAAAAPLVAAPAPIVTASSSQYISRNYNGIAAPLVASAPVVTSPYAFAAPYYAPAAKFVAPAAPYVAAASPYYAASAPLIALK
nr:calphotin-like [Vanessa tameamea]